MLPGYHFFLTFISGRALPLTTGERSGMNINTEKDIPCMYYNWTSALVHARTCFTTTYKNAYWSD